MKCYTRKAAVSTVFLMVEIAIIIASTAYIAHLIGTSDKITGKATMINPIEEAGIVDITRVTGTDATDGDIETLIITLETASEGIDLKDSLIIITVGNVSSNLKYREGKNVLDLEDGYYTR
jgi:archaellin